jgi:hypothetical protein
MKPAGMMAAAGEPALPRRWRPNFPEKLVRILHEWWTRTQRIRTEQGPDGPLPRAAM